MSLKRKVFEQHINLVITYGTETLTLIKKNANKLIIAQRAMESGMLGIYNKKRHRDKPIHPTANNRMESKKQGKTANKMDQ